MFCLQSDASVGSFDLFFVFFSNTRLLIYTLQYVIDLFMYYSNEPFKSNITNRKNASYLKNLFFILLLSVCFW